MRAFLIGKGINGVPRDFKIGNLRGCVSYGHGANLLWEMETSFFAVGHSQTYNILVMTREQNGRHQNAIVSGEAMGSSRTALAGSVLEM